MGILQNILVRMAAKAMLLAAVVLTVSCAKEGDGSSNRLDGLWVMQHAADGESGTVNLLLKGNTFQIEALTKVTNSGVFKQGECIKGALTVTPDSMLLEFAEVIFTDSKGSLVVARRGDAVFAELAKNQVLQAVFGIEVTGSQLTLIEMETGERTVFKRHNPLSKLFPKQAA